MGLAFKVVAAENTHYAAFAAAAAPGRLPG
jgi:hypothetical protein